MGVMRFLVEPAELLREWPEVHRAYLSGVDQSVWPTRIELQGNQVLCRRQASDSGKLHVAWPVPGHGRPILTTSSLPERDEPYLLALELARGKVVQVRNQLAAWQGAGMVIPAEFQAVHSEAQRLFAQATVSQAEPLKSSQAALASLTRACDAADLLTRSYIQQRLENRHRQYPRLPTALSCSLSDVAPSATTSQLLPTAFNTANVPIDWKIVEPVEGEYHWEAYDEQVQWCHNQGIVMRGGPLVDLSPDGLPRWLWQWEHDFFNLQSFVCDFVQTAITRYLGKIRLWELAARMNTGGALALNEEQRLTLMAKTLEVARQVDEESQFLVRIDQPWGEYQARGQHKLSPMYFADALIRAGLGLAALVLEIAVSYTPRGSGSRDLLDFSRMIDQWSALGMPLHVVLAFPSSGVHDDRVTTDLEVEPGAWRLTPDEKAQALWVEDYLPLLMAKPSVVGISWSHFSDASSHRFPHAGLLRPDESPKPALESIARYRKQYWG